MAAPPRPPGPNRTTEDQQDPNRKQAVTSSPLTTTTQNAWVPSNVVSSSPTDRYITHAFVERHSYDGTKADLTPFCQRASWSPSINEPWTSITVTLILPWFNRSVAPREGDWLVIRDSRGRPAAWGVVDYAPDPGIEGGSVGQLASRPITIRASSWMNLLKRAQIFASPTALAGRGDSIGTFFNVEDWLDRTRALMNVLDGNLGQTLVTAVNIFARLRMPPTLGGGFLGDMIQVVHDQASATQASTNLRIDPIRGPRIMGVDSYFPSTTNVLDIIVGTFVPDKTLIEFWETLAPLANESNQGRDKLGATPLLIYRLRPFRTQSLGSYLSNATVSGLSGSETQSTAAPVQNQSLSLAGLAESAFANALAPVAPDLSDNDSTLLALYSAPTWVPSQGNHLDYNLDGLTLPEPSRSDGERINMVTVGLPTQSDNPVRFWKQVGLPYVDQQSVERYGVRLFQPNWPFFPPNTSNGSANPNSTLAQSIGQAVIEGATGGKGPTLVGYLRTLAGLAAMITIGREKFFRGSIQSAQLLPNVDIGKVITTSWPDGRRFVAYVEGCRHEIDFGSDGGVTSGRTAIDYSRGAWAGPGDRDAPERAAVQVPTTLPVQVVTTPAPATAPKTGSRVPAPGVLFAGATIPWLRPVPLVWYFLTKPLGQRVMRTRQAIDQCIMHYTDGGLTSYTASGTWAHFNKRPTTSAASTVTFPATTIPVASTSGFDAAGSLALTNTGGVGIVVKYTGKSDTAFTGCTGGTGTIGQGSEVSNPGVDSHFIIEADGTVVQVLDLAVTAYQAGVSAINNRSISIDFVCPLLTKRATHDTSLPWQFLTGFQIVGDNRITPSDSFYAPTMTQWAAAKFLMQWVKANLAVPMVAPAASSNPKLIVRYTNAPPPGVYHHAEILRGRADCLGTYIPTDVLP